MGLTFVVAARKKKKNDIRIQPHHKLTQYGGAFEALMIELQSREK
jgi:hypothetical protein